MTDFLVRIFIKDYERTEDACVRTSYGVLASVVGICCNVALCIAKFCIGLMAHSISVTADAFNNLSDAASSIIGCVGVKMAQKPADRQHPFGHGRIEYIAAFIVAFLVIQVGFSLMKTSFGKIWHPEEIRYSTVSVAVLALSVAVKLWMAFFNRRLGKRVNSTVMMATSADSLGDVAATLATIVSMVAFGIWQVNIDGVIGLIVSVLVLVAGVNIARDTLRPLIGEPIDPKLYGEITRYVEKYDGIYGSHDLIVHNYGPTLNMASIHAELPNSMGIEEAHELVDRVERDILRDLGVFLVVHMDPVEVRDERALAFKQMATEVVKGLDGRLTLHDFRMVYGESRINLIFEVVVPHDYTEQIQDALKQQIIQKIREKDGRCHCLITTECGFCAEAEEPERGRQEEK